MDIKIYQPNDPIEVEYIRPLMDLHRQLDETQLSYDKSLMTKDFYLSKSYEYSYYDKYRKENKEIWVIAIEDDTPVAYITMNPEAYEYYGYIDNLAKPWYISNVMVSLAYRGRGLSHALMDECLKYLRGKATYVTISVFYYNSIARHLYESHKFTKYRTSYVHRVIHGKCNFKEIDLANRSSEVLFEDALAHTYDAEYGIDPTIPKTNIKDVVKRLKKSDLAKKYSILYNYEPNGPFVIYEKTDRTRKIWFHDVFYTDDTLASPQLENWFRNLYATDKAKEWISISITDQTIENVLNKTGYIPLDCHMWKKM